MCRIFSGIWKCNGIFFQSKAKFKENIECIETKFTNDVKWIFYCPWVGRYVILEMLIAFYKTIWKIHARNFTEYELQRRVL